MYLQHRPNSMFKTFMQKLGNDPGVIASKERRHSRGWSPENVSKSVPDCTICRAIKQKVRVKRLQNAFCSSSTPSKVVTKCASLMEPGISRAPAELQQQVSACGKLVLSRPQMRCLVVSREASIKVSLLPPCYVRAGQSTRLERSFT